jgi:LPXTG-motif cell wall-anchored protein
MYLASSSDGGTTWDGKTDGSGAPALVDGGGTHFVANLVAGDSGRVALIYYKTSYADTPFEAGATCPSGVPPQNPCQGKAKPEPPSAAWVLNVSETLDAQSAHPSFVTVTASDPGVVTHYGDICNLGIYCDGSTTGNRSMYENTTLFLDRNGYLVAAWTDQRADPHLEKDAGAGMNAQADQLAYDRIWSTCQVAGPSLYAHPAGPTECGRVVTVASRSASRSARAPAQTAVATTSATLPATGGDAWLAVLGAACLGGAFVVARRVGRRS